MTPRFRTSGSALILALWTLFFLSSLAVAIHGQVGAHIRLARFERQQNTAYGLARAGVSLAVSEAWTHPERYASAMPTNPAEVEANESLFKDNASVDGGVFSVYYLTPLMRRGAEMEWATNFGILRESSKVVDLDRLAPGTPAWTAVVAVVGASVAADITNHPAFRQKTVATGGGSLYGAYEAMQELLAVKGLAYDHYGVLEKFVTIQRHKFHFPRGRRTLRSSFGGTAEGVALTGDLEGSRAAARRRITFVYDTSTTNFLYWREY